MKLSEQFESQFNRNGQRRIISRYAPMWRAISTLLEVIETKGECGELYVQQQHYEGKPLRSPRPPTGQVLRIVCESMQGDTLYLDIWPKHSALPSMKALTPGQVMRNLKQLKQGNMLNKELVEMVKLASNGIIRLSNTRTTGECWMAYSKANVEIAVRLTWARRIDSAAKQA